MTPTERYIETVLAHVFAAAEERDRLAADLRAHFAEAEAAGEPPAAVLDAMGPAEDVAAAFNADREIAYAGLWPRLVAFLGDCGVLLLCSLPAVGGAVLWSARMAPRHGDSPLELVPLLAFGTLAAGLFIFYFPLLEWRFGKTLGKHLLRLRAVQENGTPLGLGRAFVRRLSLYFEMLLIDALFIPFTDKRQRALDIIAKTVVAHEPGLEAGARGYLICLLLPVAGLLALLAVALLFGPG